MMSLKGRGGTSAGATVAPNRKEIKAALMDAGLMKVDKDVLSKCVALASTLHLKTSQMVEVWEAYSLNKQNVTELTLHQFEAYKNELIKASQVSPTPSIYSPDMDGSGGRGGVRGAAAAIMVSQKMSSSTHKRQLAATMNMVTPPPTAKRQHIMGQGRGTTDLGGLEATTTTTTTSPSLSLSSDDVVLHSGIREDGGGDVVVDNPTARAVPIKNSTTPTTAKAEATPAPVQPKYEERTHVGQIVASYSGPAFDSATTTTITSNNNSNKNRCGASSSMTLLSTKKVGTNNILQPYRHMFTTLEDRAKALEKQLVEHGRAIMEDQYKLQQQQQNNISAPKELGENNIDDNNSNKDTDSAFLVAPYEEVNVPRQDKVMVVGRICNEAHEGKLNATSVVLEGSSSTCGGARINVDLTQLHQQQQQQQYDGYSVFPGQIVAMEGINPTGRKFIPHRLVEGMVPVPFKSTVKELQNYYYNNSSSTNPHANDANSNNNTPLLPQPPLKVVTACGPFTTSNSMDYQPFIDLMHVILDNPPDIVILMGPFVDMRQSLVQSANGTTIDDDVFGGDGEGGGNGMATVVSYETLFAYKIAGLIEEALDQDRDNNSDDHDSRGNKRDGNGSGGVQTQFVLIPALEDATAKWVYPQPPLQDRLPTGGKLLRDVGGAEGIEFGTLGLYRITSTQTQQQRGGQKSSTGMGNQPSNATNSRRVHCLSNPCTFQINELVFGVTSTDVLFHISAEETNANLPAGSRLRRIAQHMIQQGSYYPLFPPNKSVNLDLKQQRGWTMPCRPDVMIVPSKLTPFCAPVLESTIVINPGHLTRGMTGGTYATMEIAPVGNDRLSANHNDDDVQNKSVEDGVMQEVQLTHNVQDRIKVQVKRI